MSVDLGYLQQAVDARLARMAAVKRRRIEALRAQPDVVVGFGDPPPELPLAVHFWYDLNLDRMIRRDTRG